MPTPHVCAICSCALHLSEWASGICDDPACRHEWLIGRRAWLERERRAAVDAAAHALREAAAPSAGVLEADAYPILVTPAFEGGLAPLPRRRRRAFRAHLWRLLGTSPALEDSASSPPADEPDAATAAVLGAACANCRGACCRGGGDHAYLGAGTLRRWLASHPGAAPRDAVAAYEAHVGETAHRDSCIFHGASSCTLPRALRSDTCNRFFCEELRPLRRAGVDTDAPTRRFLAAVRDREIRRASYLDGATARPVDVR